VSIDALGKAAIESLSEEERSRAVVYVSERVLEPGEELEIDGGRVQVDAPTVVAFADLEPGVNWGHRSRYLLVDRGSGDVRAVESQFPPFLRGMPPEWKVAYQAPGVPDWAVTTE
jgi:hypothetical protein